MFRVEKVADCRNPENIYVFYEESEPEKKVSVIITYSFMIFYNLLH